MKRCSVCKENKDVGDFHKDMSRKDNLCQKCKSCKSIIDKEYAEKNKERRKKRKVDNITKNNYKTI